MMFLSSLVFCVRFFLFTFWFKADFCSSTKLQNYTFLTELQNLKVPPLTQPKRHLFWKQCRHIQVNKMEGSWHMKGLKNWTGMQPCFVCTCSLHSSVILVYPAALCLFTVSHIGVAYVLHHFTTIWKWYMYGCKPFKIRNRKKPPQSYSICQGICLTPLVCTNNMLHFYLNWCYYCGSAIQVRKDWKIQGFLL